MGCAAHVTPGPRGRRPGRNDAWAGVAGEPPLADDQQVHPLKHGYTNHTVGDGAVVEKTYEGPDAGLRLRREHALLTRLRG
jgi:hypothetical protein